MKTAYFDLARTLSNDDLIAQVTRLAARERGTTAELIAHLAELDARKLHVKAGYTSLFVYCRDALLLSEHEAYNRIEVARAARRYPLIVDLLAEGAIHLTTARLLIPQLTEENHARVLEEARGLKKPAVQELVARLAPAPDVPTSIRKLPSPAPMPTPPAASTPTPCPTPASPAPAAAPTPTPPTRAARAEVKPLSPDRYEFQLTISGDTLEKLRMAKDMLRHALPSGDDAAVLDRALTALLVELTKRKFAATDRPRASKGVASGSRQVAAEVQRAVFLRDRGRCAYVGPGGRRCDTRAFLEFHHCDPYAQGGRATVDNIELRCGPHNREEWRQADVRPLEADWHARQVREVREPRDGREVRLGPAPT